MPEAPVIVATEFADAASLLGEVDLDWPSGHTVCLDLGLRARRGDPFVVSDLGSSRQATFQVADPHLVSTLSTDKPVYHAGEPVQITLTEVVASSAFADDEGMDGEFEFGIERILDGIAALVAVARKRR